MKIKFDLKVASVYRLAYVTWSWCNKTKYGTCLKHGRPWTESRNVHGNDLNRYEVYTYMYKDKQTKTYWLVEHNVLKGTGKAGSFSTIEFIPLYIVELVKKHPDNPDYWIVKRKEW